MVRTVLAVKVGGSYLCAQLIQFTSLIPARIKKWEHNIPPSNNDTATDWKMAVSGRVVVSLKILREAPVGFGRAVMTNTLVAIVAKCGNGHEGLFFILSYSKVTRVPITTAGTKLSVSTNEYSSKSPVSLSINFASC